MDLATLLPRLARRWWLVVAIAAIAVVGSLIAVGGRADRQERTVHFVLRPDASVSDRNLPGALDVLKSDGALVQTVLGVLGSDEMLRRAAADAEMRLGSGYSVHATARPGSALYDATLAGPDGAGVDRLAAGYARAASDYVAAAYAAYSLDRLGVDAGGDGTGVSDTQVVVLALLLGLALGVGLVALEARATPARAAAREEHCRAITARGTRCRNRPVDERGYCRTHLAQLEDAGAGRPSRNGAEDAARVAEPARFRPAAPAESAERAQPRASREDDAQVTSRERPRASREDGDR